MHPLGHEDGQPVDPLDDPPELLELELLALPELLVLPELLLLVEEPLLDPDPMQTPALHVWPDMDVQSVQSTPPVPQ